MALIRTKSRSGSTSSSPHSQFPPNCFVIFIDEIIFKYMYVRGRTVVTVQARLNALAASTADHVRPAWTVWPAGANRQLIGAN